LARKKQAKKVSKVPTKSPPAAPEPPKKRKHGPKRSTKQRIMDFLHAYAETCSMTEAAKRAQVTTAAHYGWMKKFPKYRECFAEMKQLAGDYLEGVAVDRATNGWLEPIYYQGNRCGSVRRFDGGLLQFLLRGMMSERYGAKVEHTGPNQGPIETKIEVVFLEPEPKLLEPGPRPDNTGEKQVDGSQEP
jgi:hypothetical protein